MRRNNWELLVRHVVGRKNRLFADTPAGAQSSTVLYSLIESAKLNSHKPYDYLLHVFEHLPYARTRDDFRALLPCNVSPEETSLKDAERNNQENTLWNPFVIRVSGLRELPLTAKVPQFCTLGVRLFFL
jgi:hypothetical protein